MAERPVHLAHLEHLGDATRFSPQIHALIPRCDLLENFSPAEVRLLAHFMDVYQAPAGTEIIREGESGDFMLMLSQRLRSTSARLLQMMDDQSHRATDHRL